MLGLRTVAMHEGLEAALIMAGSGEAQAHRWGTGVGLSSEAAAWEDIGVEDRMLFAADAVSAALNLQHPNPEPHTPTSCLRSDLYKLTSVLNPLL